MENQIVVVGNLTADPELRYTQNGQAVVNFTIAQTKRKRDPQNPDQWIDAYTNYYRCTAWRGYAENIAETGRKGQRWMVIGETFTEEYIDKKTNQPQRSTNNINVEECGPSMKFDNYTQNARKQQAGGNRGGQQGGGFGGNRGGAPAGGGFGGNTGGGFGGGQQGGGFGGGAPAGGGFGGGQTDPWAGGNTNANDEPPF